MNSETAIVLLRNSDLITGQSLDTAEVIVDLGDLPVPGLFFPTPDQAAEAVSRVRVVKSSESGLIQLDRDVNPALYRHYRTGAVTRSHLDFVQSLADTFATRYRRDIRILEIGGGDGHLLDALHSRGFQALHCIDPSPSGQDKSKYRVTTGLFPDALAGTTLSFDVIVGQHVLEHSRNPVAMLRSARELLLPGGEVWIEVPDIVESASTDGGVWLSLIYALHSSYFDEASLARAGTEAGFTVRSVESVNHYGQSLLAVFGLGDNPPLQSSVTSSNSDAVVAAIRRYFATLKQVGQTVPSGTLCWGVAERCMTVLGGLMAGGLQARIND